jgi:hypothetical protein
MELNTKGLEYGYLSWVTWGLTPLSSEQTICSVLLSSLLYTGIILQHHSAVPKTQL